MTDLQALLERVWGRSMPAAYVECRDCGTTLTADATRCHVCDSDALVRYTQFELDDAP